MFERVVGLDVGKASVTVCVQHPGVSGSAARTDADVCDDDPLAGGHA